VHDRALESRQLGFRPAPLVCRCGARVVRNRECEVVTACLEHRQRRRDARVQLVGDSFGRDVHAQLAFLHARHELCFAVACARSPVREVRQRATRVLESPGEEQRVGQIDRQGDVVGALKGGGALEQVQGGAVILPHERTTAGARQSLARTLGQGLGRRKAQLSVVAPRLLEVVPKDLVHLDLPRTMLLEPEREALM
jgi:hypothetical protein